MIDILSAARYLIYLSYTKPQYSLTHIKLQKLLYLAQGWSFVWDNKPLFHASFEPWAYGPANIEIAEIFRPFKHNEIPATEGISYLSDKDAQETLKAIWQSYGPKSAYQLVEFTKQQEPYQKAFHQHTSISSNDICQYFQSTFR